MYYYHIINKLSAEIIQAFIANVWTVIYPSKRARYDHLSNSTLQLFGFRDLLRHFP